MSGGITDPPKAKLIPHYEKVVQGSTAGELIKQLKELPEDASVVWVDSYEEDLRGFPEYRDIIVTVGMGFKWPASQEP